MKISLQHNGRRMTDGSEAEASYGISDKQRSFSAPLLAPNSARFTFHVSRFTPQTGIALVIVMISIFVLTILAAGFAFSMKVETKLAQHANNETEMQWLGRSGVEYSRWVLSFQSSQPPFVYDSLDQAWATGHGFVGPTNNAIEVQNPVPLGHGSFTWNMTDLERKW